MGKQCRCSEIKGPASKVWLLSRGLWAPGLRTRDRRPLAVRGWILAQAALSGSPGLYGHTHAAHMHARTRTHTHMITGTRMAGRTHRSVNLAASGK